MTMLDYLIKRPIGVILSFAMVVVLGIFLFPRIPVSLLPETDVPVLSIHVNYPGGNAETIESEITKPIRLQMLQVSGIEDVWSTTENGRAELELRFRYGRNMSLAYIEANEKLDQIVSRLPDDLDRPLVNYNSLSDLPVLYLSVTPDDEARTDFVDFGLFCKNVVKRRLEQLDAVAFIDITGFDQAEIRVMPDYAKMQLLDIDETDLSSAISQNNINLGSILLKDGQYQYDVQFKASLTSIDDIRNIGIPKSGQLIPLGEVAEVRQSARDPRGEYLNGQKRGILLSVLKQPESNIFTMKSEIDESVEVLQSEYPSIQLETTLDQSQVLRVSLNNLRGSLMWGAVFAVLILFVFYRRMSAIFLIAIVIPSTIISSLLLYYLFGLSINIISLSGLILGVGLMIDNSIIIIENITQYRQQGHSMKESAVKGANEVFTPLLTSLLTTCSVFVPLLFMSGIVGALFYEQAISIAISLLMSLLIAFLIIPVLIELLGFDFALKMELDFLERSHHRMLDFALKRRWVVFLCFGAILAAAILLITPMKKEAFPPVSREGVEFHLDWNQNITLEENEARCRALIEEVRALSEEVHLLAGEQQFLLDRTSQSIQESRLICIQSDPLKQQQLTHIVKTYCASKYPFTRIEEQYLENAFDVIFRTDPNDLYIQLRPLDPAHPPGIEEVSESLDRIRSAGFPIDEVNQVENLILHIESEKAITYQVSVDVIKQRLEALLNTYRLGILSGSQNNLEINIHQREAGTITSKEKAIPVNDEISFLPLPAGGFDRLLNSTMIRNTADTLVPLSQFVQVEYGAGFREIRATRLGESFIFPVPSIEETANGYDRLRETLGSLKNFTFSLSGSYFENQDRVRELVWVLLVSLLLLFLILSAQFESVILPFVILLTIPFGIAGSNLFLYLAGQSISILSMIGIVVMAGIMVNDAILKLDMIVRLRDELGERAALYEAGKRRIKPIFMTSMTTILALVPILFSSGLGAELQAPLALAVIGGISVGTFSSILLLPLIYLLVRRRKVLKSEIKNLDS